MSDWLKGLATVAPAVATMFGGPLAGLAVNMAGRVLLGRDDAAPTSPDEAQAAVQAALATPEGLVKLRELELKTQELQNRLMVDLRGQDLDNMRDARARDVGARDGVPGRLALITIPLFFCMVAAVLVGAYLLLTRQVGVPEGARELQLAVATLIGSLVTLVGGCVKDIYSFYFGGSLGSTEKNASLDSAMRQLGAAAATRPTTDDLNARSLAAARGGK